MKLSAMQLTPPPSHATGADSDVEVQVVEIKIEDEHVVQV
jgi:hypothetical protein